MKVSFGRIIPVTSISNPNSLNTKRRVDKSTYEVAKVLNSEKSSTYSKLEAESIRGFFRNILGDYNGKNGILIRRTENGDLFLLSGKDAEKLAKKEKDKGKNTVHIENIPRKNKDSEIILSSSQILENALTQEERMGSKPIKAKIDQFQYIRTESYYTAQVDGFIRKDIEPTNKPTTTNKCENIIVNYKELVLK